MVRFKTHAVNLLKRVCCHLFVSAVCVCVGVKMLSHEKAISTIKH